MAERSLWEACLWEGGRKIRCGSRPRWFTLAAEVSSALRDCLHPGQSSSSSSCPSSSPSSSSSSSSSSQLLKLLREVHYILSSEKTHDASALCTELGGTGGHGLLVTLLDRRPASLPDEAFRVAEDVVSLCMDLSPVFPLPRVKELVADEDDASLVAAVLGLPQCTAPLFLCRRNERGEAGKAIGHHPQAARLLSNMLWGSAVVAVRWFDTPTGRHLLTSVAARTALPHAVPPPSAVAASGGSSSEAEGKNASVNTMSGSGGGGSSSNNNNMSTSTNDIDSKSRREGESGAGESGPFVALEVGAGLGALGIGLGRLLATVLEPRCRAHVLMTDGEADAIATIRENIVLNVVEPPDGEVPPCVPLGAVVLDWSVASHPEVEAALTNLASPTTFIVRSPSSPAAVSSSSVSVSSSSLDDDVVVSRACCPPPGVPSESGLGSALHEEAQRSDNREGSHGGRTTGGLPTPYYVDLVFGSDILYEPPAGVGVVNVIKKYLRRSTGSRAVLVNPGSKHRFGVEEFLRQLDSRPSVVDESGSTWVLAHSVENLRGPLVEGLDSSDVISFQLHIVWWEPPAPLDP